LNDENIWPEDCIDDANMERVMVLQRSRPSLAWAAKRSRKGVYLNNLLFRMGMITKREHLANKVE
jgi:hypothetical protein